MLSQLIIKNIAVIERVSVCFSEGFNALTGETGAGKSIIIDSINAVLGRRASRDLIRNGCDSAKVTAVFCNVPDKAVKCVKDFGADADDGVITLTREMFLSGHGQCKVNGVVVSQALVRLLASELIDIHGQNDSRMILEQSLQRDSIDKFSGAEELLEEYRKIYFAYAENESKIKVLNENNKNKNERIDYLRFVINELDTAGLSVIEENELGVKKKLIRNMREISEKTVRAITLLNGDGNDGIISMLEEATKAVGELSTYIPELSGVRDRLESASCELEDCRDEIEKSADTEEYSESDLDKIESRLYTYYTIKNKYKKNTEEIMSYRDELFAELESIEFSDDRLEALNKKKEELGRELERAGTNLSERRKAAAAELSEKIAEQLHFLDMPNVVFSVEFTKTVPSKTGFDEVNFCISVNVGEPPKPIAKIASGGELSRIMLAIKNVLANTGSVGTMIFDEIDTGVSGRAATKIAMKLKEVSRGRQLLCVTHLPQIAAYASRQLLIEKKDDGVSTFTTVNVLDGQARAAEIARMISGSNITPSALQTANELIESAK